MAALTSLLARNHSFLGALSFPSEADFKLFRGVILLELVPDGRRLGIGRGGRRPEPEDPGSLGDSRGCSVPCAVGRRGAAESGGHSEQRGAVGSAHGGTSGFLVCEVALLWSSNRSRRGDTLASCSRVPRSAFCRVLLTKVKGPSRSSLV